MDDSDTDFLAETSSSGSNSEDESPRRKKKKKKKKTLSLSSYLAAAKRHVDERHACVHSNTDKDVVRLVTDCLDR